jgi:hypothetical protein
MATMYEHLCGNCVDEVEFINNYTKYLNYSYKEKPLKSEITKLLPNI